MDKLRFIWEEIQFICRKIDDWIVSSIISFLNFIGVKVFSINSPCARVPKYVVSTKDAGKLNIIFLIMGIIIGMGTLLLIGRFYPIHWN